MGGARISAFVLEGWGIRASTLGLQGISMGYEQDVDSQYTKL